MNDDPLIGDEVEATVRGTVTQITNCYVYVKCSDPVVSSYVICKVLRGSTRLISRPKAAPIKGAIVSFDTHEEPPKGTVIRSAVGTVATRRGDLWYVVGSSSFYSWRELMCRLSSATVLYLGDPHD